ncbi:MAG: transposase [Alphaproteobacteria bacterium]|nr:transposase [Alphaproteobacteria bacterium]
MITLMPIVRENIAKEAAICTDEGSHYNQFADTFASHDRVHHTNDE